MSNKPDRYDSEEFGYTYGLGFLELLLMPFVYLINWMLGNQIRNNGVGCGDHSLIGEVVEVIDISKKEEDTKYLVRVNGEIWNLLCADDLSIGDEVTITSSYGLNLEGTKVDF